MLRLGVIGTSRKTDERRVPIHLDHLDRIPEEIRGRIQFETGYGAPFGIGDAELAARCGGLAGRAELFAQDDTVLLLPKPMAEDLAEMREHGVLWGWPHCVQQETSTQIAIDRKLTLIAFEEMFDWGRDGHRGRHTFYKNNEMAGYCAVLEALRLKGIDGHYGPQRKVVILSFGAVSRGAIYALKARGFRDITICIQRPNHSVQEDVLGCHYLRMEPDTDEPTRMIAVEHDGRRRPLLDLIGEADVLVNGILQNSDRPISFLTDSEITRLKPGSLIVDVSCDEGMGFPFARPTSFENPMIQVGSVDYYAVDHTPSYLWDSASWEISGALLRFLPAILAGPEGWDGDETLRRAIEIRGGVVQNPKILSFQRREAEYPHRVLADRMSKGSAS